MKDKTKETEDKFGKLFFDTLSEAIGLDIDTKSSSSLPKNGLYARFHKDGSLSSFGYRKDGENLGWKLEVKADRKTSVCSRQQFQEFPKDAWVHPERTTKEEIPDWIRHWVNDICEDVTTALRCSFCGKDSEDVSIMMSGKNDTYICDECVLVMADIVEERLGGEGPENNA